MATAVLLFTKFSHTLPQPDTLPQALWCPAAVAGFSDHLSPWAVVHAGGVKMRVYIGGFEFD